MREGTTPTLVASGLDGNSHLPANAFDNCLNHLMR